jgi:hypothetical protein
MNTKDRAGAAHFTDKIALAKRRLLSLGSRLAVWLQMLSRSWRIPGFKARPQETRRPMLADEFAGLRRITEEEHYELRTPQRSTRPNALMKTFNEECSGAAR